MSRFAIVLLSIAFLTPCTFAQAPKPNVLFIVADDLCAEIGCYLPPNRGSGGVSVLTPNIDRLASRGMRFERAYCQYPLCGPSRCSFLSGLRPDTTGITANGLPVRHKLKDVLTLPQLFRQNGYVAARVGKIYHLDIPGGVGTPGPDDPQSWDTTFNPPGAEFKTDGDEVIPDITDGQGFRYVMGKADGHEQ